MSVSYLNLLFDATQPARPRIPAMPSTSVGEQGRRVERPSGAATSNGISGEFFPDAGGTATAPTDSDILRIQQAKYGDLNLKAIQQSLSPEDFVIFMDTVGSIEVPLDWTLRGKTVLASYEDNSGDD